MHEQTFGPVRFIPGPNRGKYPYCHSIYVEGARILIDPAADRERLKRLRAEEGVDAVWLSHWHEDHFMHLDLFDDLPLAIHAADAPMLADMETFLDAYGLEAPEIRDRWRTELKATFHFRPRRADRLLAANEIIDLGDVRVEVLHTPGHTPGHLAFRFVEPEVLFMGDYDLTAFGPWYGDRDASIAQTVAAVRRLQGIPARIRLTGHETGVFENASPDVWDAYLAVIDHRRQALLDLLAVPRRMADIVNAWIVYRKPREPLAFYAHAEKALMGKHLEELLASGQAVVQAGGYFRRT
jgi:glyoxylase-like metal-dependent hydrolase (beta-lactamase superfamily II)